MLNVPKNSTVSIYNSGCCGMAGSLVTEHYDISMQMGRILYFQNKKYPTTTIAAAGTSCRHQILMERIETPNIRSLF
jgi:Fe-S oxidoreductase